MPDPYVDSSLQTGFDDNSLLQLKLDTDQRFQRALNPDIQPIQAQTEVPNPEDIEVDNIISGKVPDYDLNQASISTNPRIRDAAHYMLQKKLAGDPVAQGVGATKYNIYDPTMDKFLEGEFGYRPGRDNEDYYYQNEYMADGFLWRNTKNIGRFIGRVAGQALLKFGEGIGYAGSMILSAGSTNYWADVADNSLSRWLEGLEEDYKNTEFLKVYKQAGFDEKGFFSKLVDWSFWNDSVADGVAFMASAFVPGAIFSKLGKIGALAAEGAEAANWFGRSFSTTNALGKAASGIGLGSPAQLATWTLNTAMEAAQEGAGVFKEVSRRLKEERARGENNLSDEDIRERAGHLAGNTVVGNFAILGLSNAWENKLFFTALGKTARKAPGLLTEELAIENEAYTRLAKKGVQLTNPLSRAGFYGRKALEGFVAEGLWEENAQLALQRMEQGDSEYDGFTGFWQQIGQQSYDASWWGKGDQEAAESIGLGALIGIGAGTVLSKASGERRKQIQEIKEAIALGEVARQNLFSTNDTWERTPENKIVYEKNIPKEDPKKKLVKQRAIEATAIALGLSTSQEDLTSAEQFRTQRALANYVKSMTNIGMENISARFSSLSPETALQFGIDNATPNKKAAKFADLAARFEEHAKNVDSIPDGKKPDDMDVKTYREQNAKRKAKIYNFRTGNSIISGFLADDNSRLIDLISKQRNINNTSVADSVVDNLNLLNFKKRNNQQVIDSPGFKNYSQGEKDYQLQRAKELNDEIEKVKKDNAVVLQGAKESSDGFWDSKEAPVSKEIKSVSSRIAAYENILHRNDHFDALISDEENGLANFQKLTKLPDVDPNLPTTTSVVAKKYKEQQKGDFEKVLKLVNKITFSEDKILTPEEEQLQKDYKELIDELSTQYENNLNNLAVKTLLGKVATLRASNQALWEVIGKQTDAKQKAESELGQLIIELYSITKNKRVNQKIILEKIGKIQDQLEEFEKWLNTQQDKLQKQNAQIEALEEQVKTGTYKGLEDALSKMKEERDWLAKEIVKQSTWIDKLIKVLKDIAKELGKKSLAYADNQGGLELARRHAQQLDDRKNELEKAYKDQQLMIDNIMLQVKNDFRKQYLDLTQAKPEPIDPADDAINKNYASDLDAFPIGDDGFGFPPDEEEGFDGDNYQRPLSTKFFTTTFPWIGTDAEAEYASISKAPKDIQDYFAFVDYMTDPANEAEIKKKLTNATIRTLIVTKNNVAKLGLGDFLDKKKYFDENNPALTHFEIIPVVEKGGYYYYVDSKLNLLGKIGDKPDPKMIRRSLRQAKFTEREEEQYLLKYKKADLDKAKKVATDWRKTMLDDTLQNPITTEEFTITRGIPNKMKMQDGGQAKNAVEGTLIPKGKIKPDSVIVFSGATNSFNINGQNVTMPVGRPFIYSYNNIDVVKKGAYDQLHAADNSQLSPEQVASVTKVLQEMLKDHIAKVMDKVNNDKDFAKWKDAVEKAGGIEKLDKEAKRALFRDVTGKAKQKGYKLWNSNYTKFISSILYFSNIEKGKSPGRNQIHFMGPNLVFGTTGISVDMTMPVELLNSDVQGFLTSQFHNVKYFPESDTGKAKQKAEFTEYYVDKNGDLQSRVWDFYAQYLLSEKTPDGETRTNIPITTSIKTKAQHDVESAKEPYYTYISRGITILTGASTPVTKSKTAPAAQVQPGEEEGGAMAEIKRKRAERKAQQQESTPPPAASAPAEGGMAEILRQRELRKQQQKQQATEKPAAPATPGFEEEDVPDMTNEFKDREVIFKKDDKVIGDDEALRVAKGGVFRTEKDLDEVIDRIQKLLPQFPIIRLRNIIKTSSGREAWGQFLDNTIRVYENAEEGTLYHEAFEAVVNRILSNPEWRAIRREFKNRAGYFTDRESERRIKYSEATDHQAKEEIAEEFRRYMLTGELPTAQPQTRSYFKILWDFIKSIFLNKTTIKDVFKGIEEKTTIKDVFKGIEEGKFAQSAVRSKDRFIGNYMVRLPQVEVQAMRDLYDGTTAELFRNIFRTPESLSILDSIEETDESLYEPIKLSFQRKIKALEAEIADTNNEQYAESYREAIRNISIALERWGDFVRGHKLELRRLRIKFEQDEDAQDELNNLKNRNDYLKDNFKTDGKNNASKSVKFLFGTLLKARFSRSGEITETNDEINGKVLPVQSNTYLMSLAGYDEYMFKALDNFKGMNDWSRIQKRMEELAGINKIREFVVEDEQGNKVVDNEEALSKMVAGMSQEEATWTLLYQRVFGKYEGISDDAHWMLKMKVHNYVSKFAPTSWLMLDGGGISLFQDAVKRPYFETIQRQIEQGIIKNSSKFFEKNSKEAAHVPRGKFRRTTDFADFTARSAAEVKAKKTPSPVQEMIDFLGLKDKLKPEFLEEIGSEGRNEIFRNLLSIRNTLPNAKIYGRSFTIRSLDIVGYVNTLVKNLDKYQPNIVDKPSQILGLNNEMRQIYITPSLASRLFSEIQNVRTRDELYAKFPNLALTFTKDSIVMERLFNEDGTKKDDSDYKVSLDYVAGIKDTDENKGTSTSQLEFHDRYFQQFNATLSGLYFSLPADSETEWAFNFGEFVEYSENMMSEKGDRIVNKNFLPKLKTEIDMVIENNSRLLQLNEKHKSNKKQSGANSSIGTSLRFFKDMLVGVDRKGNYYPDTDLLNTIYEEINNGKNSEVIITTYKKQITRAIKNYIAQEADKSQAVLEDSKLVVGEDLYTVRGLNNAFVERYREAFGNVQGSVTMDKASYRSLIEYQKVNSILGAMESFKLLFGDPAQYKDWEKRAKSMFSPYEQVFYDETGEVNQYLNKEKNTVAFGNESIELEVDDIFRTAFGNEVVSRTVMDVEVIDPSVQNDLNKLIKESNEENAKFAERLKKPYGIDNKGSAQINEADGQSIGTLGFARHLMIKSGWRWTKALEAYYQYDTALMRRDMAKSGEYKYPDNLREIDNKLINYYEKVQEGIDLLAEAKLTPIKTLMPTFDKEGNQVLLKHSIHFMSYQVAKEFELYDLYKSMLKKGEQIFNFKSAQKVGLMTDNNGEITSYYQDPFSVTKLDEVGNPVQVLELRNLGIQVETQTSEWGQTLGSQLTKLIHLSLAEHGVPVDFEFEGTASEKIEKWNSLSDEEKLDASEKWRQIQDAIQSLKDLKLKNTLDVFSRLGVRWSYDQDGFSYEIDDLEKIKGYIHNELRRLEVDSNTVDNIELTENKKAFENPAETTPSYETISNLLWSMADKAVTSMKVNGKPFVQVASTFFNKESRKAAYINEEGDWVTVNTKAEYDKAVAEGKKLVMTSSELKFYSLGEKGINAMEVYLPNIYKKKVNEKRKALGLEPLSDKALMDHLEKNPKLLEGIGFRIPTQATSSIEFFKIKGFLPEAFGSAVVVPSAITTKAGSDFDVDKLNTYLNNFVLDKNGFPHYQEIETDLSKAAVARRYVGFIKSIEKKFRTMYKESDDYKLIEEYDEMLDEQSELVENAGKSWENLRSEGFAIFSELPYGIKQQYYNQEAILKSLEVTGVEKVLEYLNYTQKWISSLQKGSKNGIVVEVRFKNGQTDNEEIYRDEVIPIMERMIDNYKRALNDAGINQPVIDEYNAMKSERRDIDQDLQLKLAQAVAKTAGYVSLENFERLPIALQSNKGAVQNAYFQSIRNILSSRDMFAQLLSPNSADNIKAMRNEVYDALGKPVEEKQELNYAKFTSTEFIAEKRNQFIKGKYDIGIGAVSITNFANSGVVGLGIAREGKVKDKAEREILYTLNAGQVGLPFEDIHLVKVDGKYMIPISVLKDKTGALTMDKLSGYINGFVDVAKDPAIVEMGMHTEFAGVYLLLERMGLTGKTAALFMYQPVIREFLKKTLLLDSKSYFGYTDGLDTRGKIQKALLDDFRPANFKYNANYRLTDEKMIAWIKKGEDIRTGKAQYYTAEEMEGQYYALISYLKAKMYTNHLLENVQGSNHDTASIRNSESVLLKDLKVERSKKGNMVVKFEDGKIINGAEALRAGTSVKMDVAMLKNFESLFTDINLFALQRDNPKQALYKIARRVFFENPFMSQDDFVNVMRDYKSSVIDILVNDISIPVTMPNGDVKYNKMYKYYKQFFKSEMSGNIKSLYDELKQQYAGVFEENFFLKNLEVNTNSGLKIDLMEVSKKNLNNDALTREMFIEGLIKLSEYNPEDYKSPQNKEFAEKMNKLYRMIVYGAYMQYGIRYSRVSFLNLIPVKGAFLNLPDLTNAGLSKIDSYDFTYLDEQIQRAKWHRKNVVQEQMFNGIHMITPSATVPGKLEMQPTKWKGGKPAKKGEKIPPKKTNQTFFGRLEEAVNEEGQPIYIVQPNITPIMVWAGYQDEDEKSDEAETWEEMANIIKVPAIRPEFLRLVYPEDEEQTGDDKPYWDVKPIVYQLMQKGDHESYMFTQLFKKVGVEDKTMARKFIGEKNKNQKSPAFGKRSVNFLYKPINKEGHGLFNEMAPLLLDDNGVPYLNPSIIDAPPFVEQTDNFIVSNLITKSVVPVFKPETPAVITPIKAQKPVAEAPAESKNKTIGSIDMTADNVLKIQAGTKTTTVRTETQAKKIDIPVGATELRYIGGELYNVTNRGYLTIQEAGGLTAMLQSEGLEAATAAKFPSTKAWLEGKNRLYVYDIRKANDPIDPGDTPPTEPQC